MQSVSTHSHNLVIDADTQLPIFSDDGKMVLLQQIEEEVEKVFGEIPTGKPAVMTPQSSSSGSAPIQSLFHGATENVEEHFQDLPSTSKDTIERRTTWTHNDIVKLIHIYKDHASLFKSQTIRHEKIWKMMAQSMPGFSSEQIKNKFKYLKGRYIKKIENMSDKASGAEKFLFEYFQEFDELFGKDPNIKPVSIVSSLKKRKLNEVTSHSYIDNEPSRKMPQMQENESTKENIPLEPVMETPERKQTKLSSKIDKMTDALLGLREDLRNREKDRERRHKENDKRKEEATVAFKDYLSF